MEEQATGGQQILSSVSRLKEITVSVKAGSDDMSQSGNNLVRETDSFIQLSSDALAGMNKIIDGALKEDNVIVLTDVCPYSLSTDVLKSFDPFMGPVMECDILIGRNTTIPVTISKIYHTVADYQTTVEVKVYQGESEIPDENIFLNKFLLSGLPKARAGKEKVKIEFSYNLNGILDVSAESMSNRKKAGISINTAEKSDEIDEHDIELADPADWINSEHASKYRTIIKRAEKIVASASKGEEELLEEIEEMLHELKFELALGLSDKDDLDDIRDDLLEAIKAYGRN